MGYSARLSKQASPQTPVRLCSIIYVRGYTMTVPQSVQIRHEFALVRKNTSSCAQTAYAVGRMFGVPSAYVLRLCMTQVMGQVEVEFDVDAAVRLGDVRLGEDSVGISRRVRLGIRRRSSETRPTRVG